MILIVDETGNKLGVWGKEALPTYGTKLVVTDSRATDKSPSITAIYVVVEIVHLINCHMNEGMFHHPNTLVVVKQLDNNTAYKSYNTDVRAPYEAIIKGARS